MDLELIQTALIVLRTCTERAEPQPGDVAVLRRRLGSEAEGMAADDLARTIVEQCVRESRECAAARA
jgi:hypothetical protein